MSPKQYRSFWCSCSFSVSFSQTCISDSIAVKTILLIPYSPSVSYLFCFSVSEDSPIYISLIFLRISQPFSLRIFRTSGRLRANSTCLQLLDWQYSHRTLSGLKWTSIMRPLECLFARLLSKMRTPFSVRLKCSRGSCSRISRGIVFSFSLIASFMNSALLL